MTAPSVCAVMVTHHPSTAMIANMAQLISQVQGLVVVDNGSSAEEVDWLRAESQRDGFRLIENQENRGIAEALNQGVGWAKGKGYGWVILFDQDSTITDGFVSQMLTTWETHSNRKKVVSVHPRYVDPETGEEPEVRRARDGGPVLHITSGALLPTWIFDKIGWFASDYFIDCVDFEYCFRIRAAGYQIADSRDAVLLHAAGHASPRRSFLGFNFRPTNHSVQRRYYMSRNRIALCRKYFGIFPWWVIRFSYDCLRETIKCLVAERDRTSKLRSICWGTWDGLTGRMGKKENL